MAVFKEKKWRIITSIIFPTGLLFLIICIGILGYIWIEGYSLIDAFYMTIITVATVGYGEIRTLSDEGRIFTALLIIVSFGTFAYAISQITKFVIDGEFNKFFKYRQMSATLLKLENHVIICGYGRNGREASEVLLHEGLPFVVIEKQDVPTKQFEPTKKSVMLFGDATHDEVLEQAGIRKAKALITTLPNDSDNVFIVLSARTLNPKLTIISRASADNSDKKLRIAGANNVIMPDKVGGAHMASLVSKPDVIEFIDLIAGQGSDKVSLEEITLNDFGKRTTINAIRQTGVNILGLKTAEGEYIINPKDDSLIDRHTKIFVLGTIEQLKLLHNLESRF